MERRVTLWLIWVCPYSWNDPKHCNSYINRGVVKLFCHTPVYTRLKERRLKSPKELKFLKVKFASQLWLKTLISHVSTMPETE